MYTAEQTCYSVRKGKTYVTRISCNTEGIECCFHDRILTFTSTSDWNNVPSCEMTWPKCWDNRAALNNKQEKLSYAEKIFINVFSTLIAISLLGILFLVYRLYQQQKWRKHLSDSSAMTTWNLEEDKVHSQLYDTVNRESTHINENDEKIDEIRLLELTKMRDIKQLSMFLKTIDNSPDIANLHQKQVDNARGLLDAWTTDEELQKYCSKADNHLHTWEITKLQDAIHKAEMSFYKEQIPTIQEAKLFLHSELTRQNVLNELKVKISREMQSNDLAKLQLLAEQVRTNDMESEFGKELCFIKNQLNLESRTRTRHSADIKRRLTHAIEKRDSLNLTQAIQEAEQSRFKAEIRHELFEARKTMSELQEIKLLIEKHKAKIKSSLNSENPKEIEQTLLDIKLDGLGETLKAEIKELQMVVNNKQLYERLRLNLEIAIQSSDQFKIKQALSDLKSSGFAEKLES